MDAVTASNSNNHHGSTNKFFVHTLDHLTTSNIITPYTRDKLIDMNNSDAKRDFAKVRKHVLDIMALHDAFDTATNNSQVGTGAAGSRRNRRQNNRIYSIDYHICGYSSFFQGRAPWGRSSGSGAGR